MERMKSLNIPFFLSFSLIFLSLAFFGCGKGGGPGPQAPATAVQEASGSGFLDANPAISGSGVFFSDEGTKALDAQGEAISTQLAPFLRRLMIDHINVGNVDVVAATTSLDQKRVFLLVVIDHTTLESGFEEKVESLVLSAPVESEGIVYSKMQYHELVGVPFGVLFCAMTRVGEKDLLLSTGGDLLQFERSEALSAERGFTFSAGPVFQFKKMYTKSLDPLAKTIEGIVELFPGKNQTIFAVSGNHIFDLILDDAGETFRAGAVQIDFKEPLGGGEFDFSEARIIAATRSGNKIFFTSKEGTEIQNIFEMPLKGARELSDILLIENQLIPTYGNCSFKKCPLPEPVLITTFELQCLHKREPLGGTTFIPPAYSQTAPLNSIQLFDCPIACCPLDFGSGGNGDGEGEGEDEKIVPH